MITDTTDHAADVNAVPTVWGLTPLQLHDRFWAARGVQVIRQGEQPELVDGAELFLLMDPRSMAIFRLRPLIDPLSWLKPRVLWVRLHDNRERGYREIAVSDDSDNFIRFHRTYSGSDSSLARVALTPHSEIAHMWQNAADPRSGWRQLRHHVSRSQTHTMPISGRVYDRSSDWETTRFVRDLVQYWKRPDAIIDRVRKVTTGVWCDIDSDMNKSTRFVGSVWVGAGRRFKSDDSVVGPAVVWDDPKARPDVGNIDWSELEPLELLERSKRRRQRPPHALIAKRLFDILFATIGLLLVLPFFPFVMLAIYLEDGRPFFFAHRRETKGGRRFYCLKFRSMLVDADRIKIDLAQVNQADGPQFFMDDDPRLTRVGKFIRKYHIDELPQFFNVIIGDMSAVGPRPSPRKENQFCPPWREARLSVKPGLTGLWQVRRTRAKGLDFQEWIRYDIEYVEKASFRLDMKIIWKTIVQNIFRK